MLKRWLVVCLLLVLVGCDGMTESQLEAGDAAQNLIQQIDRTQVLSDLKVASTAVDEYYAQHNRYPASLAELTLSLNHAQDLTYDPDTGKVYSKTFPDL